MKSKTFFKAILSLLVLCILLLSSAQAMTLTSVKKTEKTLVPSEWYWKQSYPNYAPVGMPDFDQKQDRWKKISPGPNGVIDSTVAGDDVLNTEENCIAPGQDCSLNSTAVGDDVEEWIYCGPVAVANCLWWFDSKFSDPTGTPGDGLDQFALVQDYGAGDDHSSNNTPLLIDNLARAMNTTQKGTTYITDMHSAIVNWFNTTGLSDKFTVSTYDRPTFGFIENQIEQSQDVILLLGSYDYVTGDLLVDQSQLSGPRNDLLQTSTWWDYQSFVPTASRLDAIDLLLVSNSASSCNIQVNVYDANHGNIIGTAVLNPGLLVTPTWVQFPIIPFAPLTPGGTYYFDVLQLDSDFHYEWMYDYPNPYPPGQGWMNNVPTDPYGHPFDWAFKTEFFSPPPGSVRREGHYVTCAGVNSSGTMIAFSDPTLDIANATQNDHNDAQYVSHDIYTIQNGTPRPDINTQWWLPDYAGPSQYTVVEQAIVICPVPDTTPPTVEIIKPINALYIMNTEIIPISVPFIVGPIDINVTATDLESGIQRVDFYIDNQYKGNDTTKPYKWVWSERAFFVYTIKVVAFDTAGNSVSQELKVWKFF
jgi:hypothetical protein